MIRVNLLAVRSQAGRASTAEESLQQASGFVHHRKLKEAANYYEKWLASHPEDWNVLLCLGGLYKRAGRNDDAFNVYQRVALHFREEGHMRRAIAVYKIVLELKPGDKDAMRNLAHLMAEEGQLLEAKALFHTLMEQYIKSGHRRTAATVFREMVEADPSDLKARYKYAEFLTRHGLADEAVEQFVTIADAFIEARLFWEAVRIIERGLRVDKKSTQLRDKLTQIANSIPAQSTQVH